MRALALCLLLSISSFAQAPAAPAAHAADVKTFRKEGRESLLVTLTREERGKRGEMEFPYTRAQSQ